MAGFSRERSERNDSLLFFSVKAEPRGEGKVEDRKVRFCLFHLKSPRATFSFPLGPRSLISEDISGQIQSLSESRALRGEASGKAVRSETFLRFSAVPSLGNGCFPMDVER